MRIVFTAGAERTGSKMFAGRTCAELVQIVSFLVISLGQSRQWMHEACGMCTPVDEKHSKFHDWAKWSQEAIMIIMQFVLKHWSHCSFAAALVLAVPSLVKEGETIDTLGRRGEAMTYVALTSQDAKLIEVLTCDASVAKRLSQLKLRSIVCRPNSDPEICCQDQSSIE